MSVELVINLGDRMKVVAVCHHGGRFTEYIQLQLKALLHLRGDSSSFHALLVCEQCLEIVHQGAVCNSQNCPDGQDGTNDNNDGEAGPE